MNPEFPSFLYVLEDPRYPGDIRYIGRTQSLPGRFRSHSKAARSPREVNHGLEVYVWWRELLAQNVTPQMRVIWQGPVAQADAAERKAISGYKALGMRLLNQTDGGAGVRGLRRGPHWSKGIHTGQVPWNKGREMCLQQKLTISNRMKGVPWSAERRARFERSKSNV